MRNGWIKTFSNGDVVKGPDNDPSTSWSRSGCEDIECVNLAFDKVYVTMDCGKGDYHQSDDYVAYLSNSDKPKLIYRRLQFKLDNGRWLTVVTDGSGVMISIEENKI
jgi:hypothetical protein